MNRAVLKNNLELLKTMTECWKNVIEVPVELINNGFLKSSDPKKQSTGIQLIGLILANQINSYKMMPGDQNGMEFFKLIISFIKDKSKMLHASSSEVVGMLFKSLESQIIKIEKEQFAELFEFVRQIILGFEEDSQFITCLHKIQLNYSKITEPFLSRLVFKMPGLYGEFKQMCAECILASLPKLEDKIFNTKLFTDMITNRDSLLQLVCLKMIYTMLDQQTEEDLNRLLPIVCSFKTHSNAACRYQMILILISLFEKFNLENRVSKVLQLVNETLLIVLLDEDQSIRILAQNFWCEKANMPTSTIERLVKKIKEEKFPKLKKTSKSEIMSRNEIFFRANV
jgi:DNA-dependent protein kinase catalytic subunit